MLVFEAKLEGDKIQYEALDEALRTGLFVRNKALRYWMDGKGKSRSDLNKYCRVLAQEFPWAKKLNSMARQAMAQRAWTSIARFYDNCKNRFPARKDFLSSSVYKPGFQLSTKPLVGNSQRIEGTSASLMALGSEALNSGELVTCTSTKSTKLNG